MQINVSDESFLKVVKESLSLALITDSHATADVVSAMLAFYHLFRSDSLKIRVVVPESVPASCQSLPESSVVKSDLGPKNLLVSLDTHGSSLEKLSYYQEGATFNLVIHPRERSFEIADIKYAYQGEKFDAFIIFSVLRLADLGDLYLKNEREFRETPLLNIDNRSQNERYGSINLIDASAESLCLFLFKKLASWQLVPSFASASCLLSGLSEKGSARRASPEDSSRMDKAVQPSVPLLAKSIDSLIG